MRALSVRIAPLAVAACLTLCVLGCAGASAGRHAGSLPPFRVSLTLDGRHGLRLDHRTTCVREVPRVTLCVPGITGSMRHVLRLMYRTPKANKIVLVRDWPVR